MVEKIENIVKKAAELKEEYEKLTRQTKEIHEELESTVMELKGHLHDPEFIKAINYLYWEKDISSTFLSEVTGMKNHTSFYYNFMKRHTPYYYICPKCNAERLPLMSKNMKRRYERGEFGEQEHKYCKDCRRELEKTRSIQRNEKEYLERVDRERIDNMPYSEFIKTDMWKKFAQKNTYRCELCAEKAGTPRIPKTMEYNFSDFKYGIRRGNIINMTGSYFSYDLVLLCDDCYEHNKDRANLY